MTRKRLSGEELAKLWNQRCAEFGLRQLVPGELELMKEEGKLNEPFREDDIHEIAKVLDESPEWHEPRPEAKQFARRKGGSRRTVDDSGYEKWRQEEQVRATQNAEKLAIQLASDVEILRSRWGIPAGGFRHEAEARDWWARLASEADSLLRFMQETTDLLDRLGGPMYGWLTWLQRYILLGKSEMDNPPIDEKCLIVGREDGWPFSKAVFEVMWKEQGAVLLVPASAPDPVVRKKKAELRQIVKEHGWQKPRARRATKSILEQIPSAVDDWNPQKEDLEKAYSRIKSRKRRVKQPPRF